MIDPYLNYFFSFILKCTTNQLIIITLIVISCCNCYVKWDNDDKILYVNVIKYVGARMLILADY